jgi:hypothetical protein
LTASAVVTSRASFVAFRSDLGVQGRAISVSTSGSTCGPGDGNRMDAFRRDGFGHLAIQNSRPQTIGYGLVDSPLLQLAWPAETFHEWTKLPVDCDQLLITVSLYWFTGSDATAAHALYEQARSSDWGQRALEPRQHAGGREWERRNASGGSITYPGRGMSSPSRWSWTVCLRLALGQDAMGAGRRDL